MSNDVKLVATTNPTKPSIGMRLTCLGSAPPGSPLDARDYALIEEAARALRSSGRARRAPPTTPCEAPVRPLRSSCPGATNVVAARRTSPLNVSASSEVSTRRVRIEKLERRATRAVAWLLDACAVVVAAALGVACLVAAVAQRSPFALAGAVAYGVIAHVAHDLGREARP